MPETAWATVRGGRQDQVVEDVEYRPARPEEVPVIGALVRRADVFDRFPRVLSDEELESDLASPHHALQDDTRVAVRDGEIIGWANLWNPPAHERLDRSQVGGVVAPEHRGQGIGRRLLGWSIDRSTERQRSRDHDLPRFIRVNAYDWLADRDHLYRRLGFEAVRWNDELLRPLVGLPPVDLPVGVVLVPWPDDRDEEIRTVRNAAFADHWGSILLDAETWQEYAWGHGSRPDLSVIAVDERSGEVLGLCLNQSYPVDEAVTGRQDAWVGNIATAGAARGRGVASAMLAWSLNAFAAAGFSHAVLAVDTDNPTGAPRLYRRLGFEPLHREVTYEIEVAR